MTHVERHPQLVEGCYACQLSSVRFNGLYRLRLHREAGTTERGETEKSVRAFKSERGYWPEKA